MFARQVLPNEAYLPIGNLCDLGRSLLLAQGEVVAPL